LGRDDFGSTTASSKERSEIFFESGLDKEVFELPVGQINRGRRVIIRESG
jgi:hypothetical protein